MGKYIRGNVDDEVVLTTLGAKSANKADMGSSVNERTLVSSIVAMYTMSAFTKSTGDGPIMVGIAHSDYTVAEIEQWIESTGSWNEGDQVSQEIGKRKIRQVGIFENPVDEAASVRLNDGKAVKTKLNWILLQGQTLAVWGYNLGSSPLATTAPIVAIQGHANLWPR